MKEQSTTKGFAILSAASMLVKVLSLLYVPFLTRILTQKGYGIYGTTYSIFTFIYVLTNSGIPVAVSKLISELIAQKRYKDVSRAFKIARAMLLALGIIMSLLMIILARPLADVGHAKEAYLSLIALSPTILITAVLSAYRGYFQGRGNMTPTAISQVGEQILNTVFSLVFAAVLVKASVEYGVAGATVGTTAGALFACIYLMIMYEKNKVIKIPKGENIEEQSRLSPKTLVRKIIHYGFPITMSVGLQNAGNLVDTFNIRNRLMKAGFTGNVPNEKYATLTQYNTLINVPITLISALSAAILPSISGAAALKDRKQLQAKIGYAFKLCLIISVPSAVGLAVLGGDIFSVLFPSGARDGALLMRFGSIVIVLMSLVQIQNTILQGMGKMYAVTFSMLLGIIIKILANYLFVAIPSINILGAIVGNILCFLIPIIINRSYINNSLGMKLKIFRYAIRPVIASVFMAVSIYAIDLAVKSLFIRSNMGATIKFTFIMITIIVGGVVYAYSLVLCGGITKKDMSTLPPRLVRVIPSFIKERMR